MKRVMILGCPGSGKSTIARELNKRTGLPLVHLDNIWWKPDRTHITRDEFDAALRTVLSKDEWIVDGDYSRTYEMRFSVCDTVVFLDYDEQVCMNGIINRIGKARPDMPWPEKTLDPELVELVRRYRSENRPKILDLLRRYPDREAYVFRDRAEADAWIKSI